MFDSKKKILVTFASLLLTTTHAFAQSTNPAWLDEVTMQLAFEEQCNVG